MVRVLAGIIALLLMAVVQAPANQVEPAPEQAPEPRPAEVERHTALEVSGRSHWHEPELSDEEPDSPDCSELACIALTFDDGPVPGTDRLLDILETHGVPATFFLIGHQIGEHKKTASRIVEDGHAVGNHGWNHRWMPKLDRHKIETEIDQTTTALREIGAPDPMLFRAPYGATSQALEEALFERGYSLVMWNIDPEDWRMRDSAAIERAVVEAAEPGGIILLHDIYDSTIDAVPGIITQLHSEGYTFVTVPQLLGEDLHVGEVYYHRPL